MRDRRTTGRTLAFIGIGHSLTFLPVRADGVSDRGAGGLRTRGMNLTCRVPPPRPGPGHRWRRSTGRSSGLRLVGPRTAFPPRGSGVSCPGAWPNTAAAPRRVRTGFPILPRPRREAGAPIERIYYRRAISGSQACGRPRSPIGMQEIPATRASRMSMRQAGPCHGSSSSRGSSGTGLGRRAVRVPGRGRLAPICRHRGERVRSTETVCPSTPGRPRFPGREGDQERRGGAGQGVSLLGRPPDRRPAVPGCGGRSGGGDSGRGGCKPVRVRSGGGGGGERSGAAGLPTSPRRYVGWVGVETGGDEDAVWLLRAVLVEQVLARREGKVFYLPVAQPRVQAKRPVSGGRSAGPGISGRHPRRVAPPSDRPAVPDELCVPSPPGRGSRGSRARGATARLRKGARVKGHLTPSRADRCRGALLRHCQGEPRNS